MRELHLGLKQLRAMPVAIAFGGIEADDAIHEVQLRRKAQ